MRAHGLKASVPHLIHRAAVLAGKREGTAPADACAVVVPALGRPLLAALLRNLAARPGLAGVLAGPPPRTPIRQQPLLEAVR